MAAQITNIILYSLTILCSVAQICVSVYVLLLMIVRRSSIREQQQRIDYLLIANTYIASLFIAIFLIDMCAYSIHGQIFVEISYDGWWCKIKGYLLYIGGCTLFYTFALQAIYRLVRILYGTQIRLHSFRLYKMLSISLWVLSFFQLLPSFLIGDIEYIHNDYHCQFSLTSIRGSFTIYSLGFLFPFTVTIFCYIWTMFSIRQQSIALVTINQQASINRDVIILKRLLIFLTFVTIAGLPHVFIPVAYIIIGYLPLWIVSFEWISTSLGIFSISIILLFYAPHLKKLRTRIQPVGTFMLTARQGQ